MAQMVNSNREYIPTANTVGYYKLNGDATDSSGNGNNGTATNVTWADGKIGTGCGSFNGTSSSINLGNRDWGIATNFTFAAWINVTNYADFRGILNKDDGTTVPLHRHFFFRIKQTTGNLTLLRFDSSNNLVTNLDPPGAVGTNTWVHVAATFDNAVGSKIFINGVKVNSDTVKTNNATVADENTYIGARDSGSLQNFFSGKIDEVIIESATWSETQVADYYQQTKGLYGLGQYLGAGSGTTKALYRFNGNCSDDSGNSNNGTPTAITYVPGRLGQYAASFNGSTSRITISNNASLNFSSSFTISCFIKFTALPTSGNQQRIYDDISSSPYGPYPTLYNNSGTYQWYFGYGTTDSGFFNHTISAGVWYNMIFVHNDSANTDSVYVNGVSLGTNTGKTGNPGSPTGNKYIGTNGGTFLYNVNGNIEELILENREWTASEVRKYYTYAKGRFI